MPQASVIVVGNEKGGAGKSTIAIHTAAALLHADAKVAVLDLDLRQQSMNRFFDNRRNRDHAPAFTLDALSRQRRLICVTFPAGWTNNRIARIRHVICSQNSEVSLKRPCLLVLDPTRSVTGDKPGDRVN